jgi:hypothetical protein
MCANRARNTALIPRNLPKTLLWSKIGVSRDEFAADSLLQRRVCELSVPLALARCTGASFICRREHHRRSTGAMPAMCNGPSITDRRARGLSLWHSLSFGWPLAMQPASRLDLPNASSACTLRFTTPQPATPPHLPIHIADLPSRSCRTVARCRRGDGRRKMDNSRPGIRAGRASGA